MFDLNTEIKFKENAIEIGVWQVFAQAPITWVLYIVTMFSIHFNYAMGIQFTIKSRPNGLLDNQSRCQLTFDNEGESYFNGGWLTVTAVDLRWRNLPIADDSIPLAPPNELMGASSLHICHQSSCTAVGFGWLQ